MTTRAGCLARDAAHPLAPLRGPFALERVDAEGLIAMAASKRERRLSPATSDARLSYNAPHV
jgi:hypothetical protein